MKKILSVFILMLAVFVLLGISVSAKDEWSWTLEDDVLTISGTGAVPDYYEWPYGTNESVRTVIVEEGITELGTNAFCRFFALESAELPDSLYRIGIRCFSQCGNLTDVTIPPYVEEIGEYAFYDCKSLTSIALPNTIDTLGHNIFWNCQSLRSVTLPSNLKHLPHETFSDCTSLKTITLPSTLRTIGASAFTRSGLRSITLPEKVTVITEGMFEGCERLESISFLGKVTDIERYAFYNAKALESIDIPASVNYIGYASFSGSGLEGTLVIPEGVETIDYRAFSEVPITELELPASLTFLGEAVFYNTQIEKITVSSDNQFYASLDGSLYTKDLKTLYLYKNGCEDDTFIIPASVTKIEGYTFGANKHLEKVVFPYNLCAMNNKAFNESEYLQRYSLYCHKGSKAEEVIDYYNLKKSYVALEKLYVVSMPEVTVYAVNELFNPEGLVLGFVDELGSVDTVTSNYTVNYDFSEGGEREVIFGVADMTVSITVTVDPSILLLPESDHPYASGIDEYKTLTLPEPYDKMYITFSEETEVEGNFDRIFIYDGMANEIASYTGAELAGVTVEIPGNSVTIRLTSDHATELYGYKVVDAWGIYFEPDLSVDNYDVSVTNASNITYIRYALGEYTTASAIKNAQGCVTLNAGKIAEFTQNNTAILTMADGGYYSFWIKLNDGTEFIKYADLNYMTPVLSAIGVKVTLSNLYGVKDYFISKGDYNSYAEIKKDYIVLISSTKIGNKHSYTYTVSQPGIHTVYVRFNDSSREPLILKIYLEVTEPSFTPNGLQLTVGNLDGVKVIRTAYGDYSTPGEIKRAAGARGFSGNSVLKGKNEYTIQYRENGVVTVAVVYNNGYEVIYKYDVAMKSPIMTQEENRVTFTDLYDLKVIRYAMGEYTTSNQIKNAKGSVSISASKVTDDKYSVTLTKGTYTFCVQYNDESYNYYTVTVE